MKNTLWVMLLLSFNLSAATIAVIDSGVDIEHVDLVNNIWMNESEVAGNNRDDDRNGYQDDVYGWNFAEANNLVIDRKYIATFSSDPYKFFDIQGKQFLNQASEAEIAWLESKRGDAAFAKEMGIFGNFVHGTHVAGITANNSPNAKIISVKLIPTEVKPFGKSLQVALQSTDFSNMAKAKADGVRIKIIKKLLKTLAKEQLKLLEEIAAYVDGHGADIANGSFGTGFPQAVMIITPMYKIAFRKLPTEAQAADLANYLISQMITYGSNMVKSAPNTLFVFASGNDGLNNDEFPASPTNIQADNVISVGATYKNEFIAPFSNYGTKMVDVAAPGMLIKSQIPGNEYLHVSGTSQAAPFVANVAAQIKDANPALKPLEIKKILMQTVDSKGFLADKVKSKGIVNMGRAIQAARLSLTMNLSSAISFAKSSIFDIPTNVNKSSRGFNANAIVPIQLGSQFSL